MLSRARRRRCQTPAGTNRRPAAGALGAQSAILGGGGMVERSKALVLKTSRSGNGSRGFESHSLRPPRRPGSRYAGARRGGYFKRLGWGRRQGEVAERSKALAC